MDYSSRQKPQTAGALRLLVAATLLVAALMAGGAIAADSGTPSADVTSDATASQLSLDANETDDDSPYERPDDGEGTIFEAHEVVTRGDDDTAISGRVAERGEQTAVVETEDGVAVRINDDEAVVTANGDRVTTVSGTPVNRFEVDDGGDLRTADEPFEELQADEDNRIVTASGEPVTDERGTELVANRDALPYDVQFDVQFTDVVEPDEGEAIEATTEINNTGLADDTQQIELVFNGAVVDNETVSAEGETTETVELAHTTEDGDWGFDQELLVRSEDDSDQTTINVSRGGLRVADSDWNAPVQAGETFETSITIERAGNLGPDRSVSYELVFEVDDDIQTRRIVSLDSGETTTETFEYETDADDPPTLPHQVTVGDRQFPAAPEVLEPEFTVETENVTDDVVAGDSVRLNGTVRNEGRATDEQEIALQLNDSEDGWRTVDTQAVELAPANETTVEFFYRTSAATPEELDLRMASNATEDGDSVSVEETDDELRVVDVEPDETPVDGGSVVTFDATVENSGNETRSVSVTLERGLELLHEREIDVPANGTATAALPTQAPVEGGSYQYSAAIRGDAATTVLEVNETDDETGEGDADTETTANETDDGTDDGVDAATTEEEDDTDEEDGETDDQAPDEEATDEQQTDDPEDDTTDEADEPDEEEADEDGLPWLTIGGAVVGVLVVVGVVVAATRAEELPIDIPDAPSQLLQTARASAATAAGTVAQQLPVDIGIGSTGQVTVANVTTDEVRFKIRCRTPEEVTLFEDQTLAASDTVDLDGLPGAGPVKIEINVKDGPRDDIEITSSDPLSAAQVVVQAYDIDFTVE